MKGKNKNPISRAIDLDKKKPPSDKIFSALGITAGAFALLLLAICLMFFLAARYHSRAVWFFLYYPMVIAIMIGLVCSVGQLLRNKYFSTIAALFLSSIAAVIILIVSIYQGVIYGQVFAFPFYIF